MGQPCLESYDGLESYDAQARARGHCMHEMGSCMGKQWGPVRGHRLIMAMLRMLQFVLRSLSCMW